MRSTSASGRPADSKPWRDAITFYVDLLKNYGPPGSSANSFNEILALYNAGKCGMWVDATIAASFITDPKQSKVADKVAFAQAPTVVTPKGANWLWAWALAIPAGSTKTAEAQKFMRDFSHKLFQHGENTIFGAFGKAPHFLPVHLHLGGEREGKQLPRATFGGFIWLRIDRNQNTFNQAALSQIHA